LDEDVWEDLIKEVDMNGDGEVSFKEFKKMMHGMLVGKSDKESPEHPADE